MGGKVCRHGPVFEDQPSLHKTGQLDLDTEECWLEEGSDHRMTRAVIPNQDAWRPGKDTQVAYTDFVASLPGARRNQAVSLLYRGPER